MLVLSAFLCLPRRLLTAFVLASTASVVAPATAGPDLDPLRVRVIELDPLTKRGELYCEVSNQHPTLAMTYVATLIVSTPEGAKASATFEGALGPGEGAAFLFSASSTQVPPGPLTVTLRAVARFEGIEEPLRASASARVRIPF
jgi:hypothetical protein